MSSAGSQSLDASISRDRQRLGNSPGKPAPRRDIVNSILIFLSTGSNEAVAASFLGLALLTYFLLGRIGLLFIGITVGVILHASWEIRERDISRYPQIKKRKHLNSTGLELLDTLLQWRAEVNDKLEREQEKEDLRYKDSDDGANLISLPKTYDAIEQLKDALLRNYIDYWYSPLYPQELGFPNACRKLLDNIVSAVASRFSRRRPADTLLDFMTKSSSIFIVLLQELSLAFEYGSETATAEVVSSYIRRNPQSSLAHLLDEKLQQQKLEIAAESLLQSYLDPKAYAFEPARYMLKSVLTISVLRTTLNTCAKAEWINGWIIYLLQDSEPELISALDSGVGQSLSGKLKESQGQLEENAAVPRNSQERAARWKDERATLTPGQSSIGEAEEEVRKLNALIAEDNLQNDKTRVPIKDALNRTSISNERDDSAVTYVQNTSRRGSDSQSSSGYKASLSAPNLLVNEQESLQTTIKDSTFTDFSQLGPSYVAPSEDGSAVSIDQPDTFTLLNSRATILSDAVPTAKLTFRSKPTTDFFIQVEPASRRYPGWIVGRKYLAFESLHEVLRRISVISGLNFNDAHDSLPHWKGETSHSLSAKLESYLNDALLLKPLAESEGMRRFFEKIDVYSRTNQGRAGFSLENVGKGMKDVFSKAPKEVAGGGKAFIGGVSGVFSGVGGLVPRRATNDVTSSDKVYIKSNPNSSQSKASSINEMRNEEKSEVSAYSTSFGSFGKNMGVESETSSGNANRRSIQGSSRNDEAPFYQQMEGLSSQDSLKHSDSNGSDHVMYSKLGYTEAKDAYSGLPINLPPPPSNISDTYNSNVVPINNKLTESVRPSAENPMISESPATLTQPISLPRSQVKKASAPITINEAQIILELIFADINELYTLSSAWNFRKTLLNAAKAYLFRPGNLHMEKIRSLLQEKIIDANTSDDAIAYHINTLRRNSVPTDEVMEPLPIQMSEEELLAQRNEAKKLLVERGMPQALIGVMGAAASREALNKLFDCLQLESVARGLLFGLLMQILQVLA